jgi:hypothetical protein
VALATTLASAILIAACAPKPADSAPSPPRTHHPKRGEGAMRGPRPTSMANALKEVGLDVKNLPPIESLDMKTKLHVMRTFEQALGVGCDDCHAGTDFKADTHRTRIAKRMWNQITRVVALDGGEPVYCDSCHQGDMFILDRRVDLKLIVFMTDEYAGKLERVDGRNHDCPTCHGDPMDPPFLNRWRESSAPDIDPVTK